MTDKKEINNDISTATNTLESKSASAIDNKESNKLSSILLRLIKGVIIGIGAIMPGLSGGVLMVIFGIYDHLIYFLSHLRQRFWQQLLYFIPVGIGGIAGIIIFSIFVTEAFASRFVAVFISLFIGFVIGTLPSLWRNAGKKGRGRRGWIAFILAAIFIFISMMMGQEQFTKIEGNTLVWALSGALIGLGFVIPGLATSNFLMYFGLYDQMAAGIQSFNWSIIIPLFLGLLAAILLLAKLVNWLLENYYEVMYHIIFGLVVGSSIAMVPALIAPSFSQEALANIGVAFWQLLLMAIAALFVGILLSLLFAKLEDRYPAEDINFSQMQG